MGGLAYALGIALSWTLRYAPGQLPLELAEVETIDEPIFDLSFLPGGERVAVGSLDEPKWSLRDWTRSGELAKSAKLGVLTQTDLDVLGAVLQGRFADGRMDLLAWEQKQMVHYRLEGHHRSKTVLPVSNLWFAPDGELFRADVAFYKRAREKLGVDASPTPVWRPGRWAVLQSDGSDELLLFDAQTGAPVEKFTAPGLREVFAPPSWDGLLYTYESGPYLRFIACDAQACSSGDVGLTIDYADITAADYHPEVHRLAVCQGTSLWLYAGSHDDVSLLLGRGSVPGPCVGVWIASANTVLVQLDDGAAMDFVVARFSERR